MGEKGIVTYDIVTDTKTDLAERSGECGKVRTACECV